MLIFRNGHIAYKSESTAELFDTFGNPLPDTAEIIVVSCYIDTTSENRKGRYDDGFFAQYQLSINLNMSEVPQEFNPSEVQVTHSRKGYLGTFAVQRVEYYDLTQTVVLWL